MEFQSIKLPLRNWARKPSSRRSNSVYTTTTLWASAKKAGAAVSYARFPGVHQQRLCRSKTNLALCLKDCSAIAKRQTTENGSLEFSRTEAFSTPSAKPHQAC